MATLNMNMHTDSFHEVANRFVQLKNELTAVHEREVERLRNENAKLLDRLNEADQHHVFVVPSDGAIPGSMPRGRGSLTPDVDHQQQSSPRGSRRLEHIFNFSRRPSRNSHNRDSAITPSPSASQALSRRTSKFAEFFRHSDHSVMTRTPRTPDGLLTKDEEEVVKADGKEEQLIQEYELSKRADPFHLLMHRFSLAPSIDANDSQSKRFVINTISMPIFDAFIGFVILANAVTIGIETTYSVREENVPIAVEILDNIFLMIYIIELAMRLYALGPRHAFKSHYVKFDAFLVLSGILDFIIKRVVVGESADVLDQIMLIRMLRLARLARTVRLMVQFRTLWLLVQGMMHSLLTLLWTLVIILIFCYCFSIVGMEFIRSSPAYGEEYQAVVRNNFTNLRDAMLMHLQFLTLDDISEIYRPLIEIRPELSIYFVSFIMLVSIALMNLVTAIMVESSMRQAKEDQVAQKAWEAAKKKALMPKLRNMFLEMDEDGSGLLDVEELRHASEDIKSQLQRICNMEDVEEIFKSLDYDESGAVDIDEFCQGLLKATSDRPGELVRIMKQCAEILKNTRHVASILTMEYPEHVTSGKAQPQLYTSSKTTEAFTPIVPLPHQVN